MVRRALAAAGPVRTCIGCRQRVAATGLVRVVAAGSQESTSVVIDRRASMPGRGAWLHPDPQCLRIAVKRRAFGPALRMPGLVVTVAELEDELGGFPTPIPSDIDRSAVERQEPITIRGRSSATDGSPRQNGWQKT